MVLTASFIHPVRTVKFAITAFQERVTARKNTLTASHPTLTTFPCPTKVHVRQHQQPCIPANNNSLRSQPTPSLSLYIQRMSTINIISTSPLPLLDYCRTHENVVLGSSAGEGRGSSKMSAGPPFWSNHRCSYGSPSTFTPCQRWCKT